MSPTITMFKFSDQNMAHFLSFKVLFFIPTGLFRSQVKLQAPWQEMVSRERVFMPAREQQMEKLSQLNVCSNTVDQN